jgi:lipopolysaccharide biosynthesis regulator YciM
MKIKFLMAGLFGLFSVTAFAQKGELSNAQSEYDKYEGLRGQPALALPSLNKAKESIDKAAVNAKTATLPQTYALKGAIYGSFAERDTVETTSMPNFTIAEESLKKAKETDAKGEFKKLIDNGYLILAQYQIKKGVKAFQGQQYDVAYKAFDFYRSVLPEDTTAILYTGLAALNSKNYPAAITNYTKLANTKYSKAEGVFGDLSSIYLTNKDTVGALKAISDGLAKYPQNAELRKREIEISLQTGKQKEILDKILTAISNDPKNKELYYYAGLVYSQSADVTAQKIGTTKDVAGKTALQAQKTQDLDKARDMYKKALELDPGYFEANLNMGYVLISPAIDSYNAANKLPANKQKEYDAAMAKANVQFDVAKPYLLKAVEVNPKSVDALNNLMTYYKGKKDDANAAKTKAQIDALSKGGK